MTISRDRFSLALERLKPSDWEHFESLASSFLAAEFGTLRTFAAPGGDGGRDAILFRPDGEPETVFQYSVTDDWSGKIRGTAQRLKLAAPQTRALVYVSNRAIGARADSVRKELRKSGLHLDIRDSSFFLERANEDTARSAAAAELARRIVDPLLEDRGVLAQQGVLSGTQANTALVFVEMQQKDEAVDKGLTRSCFEALVKAALHGSTPNERVSRSELLRRVQASLPQHTSETLARFVDAALRRLKRKAVSQWGTGVEAEYCINNAELERQKDVSAALIAMLEAFDQDVTEILENASNVVINDRPALVKAVHKIVQIYFLRRGEEFATSVARDDAPPLHDDDLSSIVREHFPSNSITGRNGHTFGILVVNTLLATPSNRTRDYLRLLSDSYTLMSFLSATPDVQAATRKLFSHGAIWVDTGVVLPIFAETAMEEENRPFTAMFRQARLCGIRLHVTWGVVEEIERHLNRCRVYSTSAQWEGAVPYVYVRYILSGGKQDSFRSWLENFTGPTNPVQDLADYLSEELGFIVGEETDTTNIPDEIRDGLTKYWRTVHENRRNIEGQEYNINIDKLTRHDVENCLIVLAGRLRDRQSAKLGQKSWWLTLDRAAARMVNSLDSSLRLAIGHPLVLSLDFLMRYIAFGPNRERSSREEWSNSRVFAQSIMEVVPPDLLRVAVDVRKSTAGLPERIIRRRLRDAMDIERAKIGPLHDAGLEGVADALLGTY